MDLKWKGITYVVSISTDACPHKERELLHLSLTMTRRLHLSSNSFIPDDQLISEVQQKNYFNSNKWNWQSIGLLDSLKFMNPGRFKRIFHYQIQNMKVANNYREGKPATLD